MSTMRSRVLLLATALLLVTGGAAAQAVFSEPDAGDAAPRKRASVAEPDAADAAAAPVAPRRAAPVADDAAAAVAPAAPAAAAPVSAVADAGGAAEEPQSLRPKTQLATKYEPGQKILSDEGLPLVDRYVAGSLLKSVKDSGGNTVCEMVLQGEYLVFLILVGEGASEAMLMQSISNREDEESEEREARLGNFG